MPEDVVNGAEVRWITCPGCAGEIGVPPHWLAHTVACPKCGAIVSISEVERVLWRPPEPNRGETPKSSTHTIIVAQPAPPRPATNPPAASDSPVARQQPSGCMAAIDSAARVVGMCVIIIIGLIILLAIIAASQGRESPLSGSVSWAQDRKTRTSLFGIEADGNKFVYVFDRSASMGSGTGSSLEIAKRELLKSLAELDETDRFQIIFYNEQPMAITFGRQQAGLLRADRQNQDWAEKFVRGIIADGGTHHSEALEVALHLGPDVIFFLTDCELPEIPARDLARLQSLNSGRTVVHAIEFGQGAKGRTDNFLTEPARQNGGQYAYVDISARSVR